MSEEPSDDRPGQHRAQLTITADAALSPEAAERWKARRADAAAEKAAKDARRGWCLQTSGLAGAFVGVLGGSGGEAIWRTRSAGAQRWIGPSGRTFMIFGFAFVPFVMTSNVVRSRCQRGKFPFE